MNGSKINDTKRKPLKLVLVCLIYIGMVAGLALFVQSLSFCPLYLPFGLTTRTQ